VTVIFFFFLLFAIETSYPIRASNDAIFTPDAFSKILHDDSVFTAIGCLGGTDRHTWSVVTMHTGHRDELCIHLRIFAMGHSDDLIPINLSSPFLFFRGSMGDIVFGFASNGTRLAANTFVQINNHAPSWHFILFAQAG
jgi:hypothetical protein